MAHVAAYKKEIVKKMIELSDKYNIIGCLNMENLPGAQLQVMKRKLRGKMEIFMAKKRLMKLALAEAGKNKKNLEKIQDYFKGMPALIFTNENPFAIYKVIKSSKSEAPAKPGQEAPHDIEIKAGPTPFPPGPVISELGALKLKTKVENGKVTIVEDAVVCKEGEVIDGKLSSMLLRLDIKPMEIGLDLITVYENGEFLKKDVLDIDEDKFMADLGNAGMWALNLSCEIGYTTKDNIGILLGKAFRDSKAVALEANIMADLVKDEILAKAEAQANAVKEAGNIEVGAKKAVEPAEKEEKPVEEKKEAPKEEKKEEPPKESAKKEAPKEKKKEEPKPAQEEKKEEAPKPDDTEVKKEPEQAEEKAESSQEPTEEQKEEMKEKADQEEKAAEEQKEEKVEEEVKKEEKEQQADVQKEEEKKGREEASKDAEKIEQAAKKMDDKVEEIASTEEKVEKIVEQAQQQSSATVEKAEEILKEVKDDIDDSKEKIDDKKEAEKEKPKNEKEGNVDREEVENLAEELMRKGTLRK